MEHDEAIRMIRAITTAFDEHDLDEIMAHFADDAVFEGPRGPHPWGQRFVGHDEVRNAFAGRFSGIPDIRYQEDDHFVDGDRGASEWTLSGPTPTGEHAAAGRGLGWSLRAVRVGKDASKKQVRTTQMAAKAPGKQPAHRLFPGLRTKRTPPSRSFGKLNRANVPFP